MAGKKRRRPIHLHVMVSEDEQEQIQEHMTQVGVRNDLLNIAEKNLRIEILACPANYILSH